MDYLCQFCGKSFTKRCNVKRHLREVHNCDQYEVKSEVKKCDSGPYTCTLCNSSYCDATSFHGHLPDIHGIELETESFTCATKEEFFSWKASIESESNITFIQKTGKKENGNKCSYLYFNCNRSGFFQPKLGTIKELKVQGSCKINGYCPSRIKVKFVEDGKCIVDYCNTHVGHLPELAHKRLTFQERKSLATKIANRVPFDCIIDEVQPSLNDSVKRINLLTKHDLHNIKAEFGLNSDAVKNSNDAVSVDASVEEEVNSQKLITDDRPSKSPVKKDQISDEELIMEVDSCLELQDIHEQVHNENVKTHSDSLDNDKVMLKLEFERVVQQINSTENVKMARDLIKSLEVKLSAENNPCLNQELKIQKSKCPANKKAEEIKKRLKPPQNVVVITKKNKRNTQLLKRVSREESMNIALSILRSMPTSSSEVHIVMDSGRVNTEN